jgi:protein-disulfide isomerase
VRDGVAQGTRLGINSTPTVFVNGRRVEGAQSYEVFAALIDEELSKK